MSAENRKKILLGFGVLAVVVIVALALWPPSFRKEEASGAIGAVQKHRAPQITRQDVVLGNEATRRQQKILYADFLNDAAKLQSISNQIGMMAARLEAANFEAEAKKIADVEADVQARYNVAAKDALNTAVLLNKNAGNRDVANGIEELSAVLANHQKLSEAEMQLFNTKLAHLAQMVEQAESKAASHLKDADLELAQAVVEIQNRAFDAAIAKLDSAARDLNVSSLESESLANEVKYLEETALEAKTLKDAKERLGMLASSPQVESQLANIERDLANRASELESKGVKNIEEQFNNDRGMAAVLAHMDLDLSSAQQAASKAMENRAQDFNKEIAAIRQELDARKTEFAALAAADVEFELASIQLYLDQRSEAASSSQAASMAVAESRGEAVAQAELGHVLANLRSQLAGSSALASILQNAPELEARATVLESRTRAARAAPSRRRRAY
jgi:hypothetical protein